LFSSSFCTYMAQGSNKNYQGRSQSIFI